jgi:nitrate/nitrite transport system permease protein
MSPAHSRGMHETTAAETFKKTSGGRWQRLPFDRCLATRLDRERRRTEPRAHTARPLGNGQRPGFVNGPNDKGVGIQLALSLSRVFAGWALGLTIAVPAGIVLGLSPRLTALADPVMQVMRPISPLAWFPIGLAVLRSSPQAVIFVIAITSLWPTLFNTQFGVQAIPLEYRNVARVFRFSRWQYITRIAIPHSLPHIATGIRLSMGIAWLVIVAAEMLAGGTGIGYFIWDSFNSLSMTRVISAIIIIGIVGLVLDRGLAWLAARTEYAT